MISNLLLNGLPVSAAFSLLELLKPSDASSSFLSDPFTALIAKLLQTIRESNEGELELEIGPPSSISLENLSPSVAIFALSNLLGSLSLSLSQKSPSESLGSLPPMKARFGVLFLPPRDPVSPLRARLSNLLTAIHR